MNQTKKYQLNLWDKTDRIQMEDFNADNAKIEAALSSVAEQAALVTQCGNCQLYYGTYTGTGSGATVLSFEKKPLFVTIMGDNIWITAVQGAPVAIAKNAGEVYGGNNAATWSGNSVSLVNRSNSAESQCNEKGATYYVMALMNASAE